MLNTIDYQTKCMDLLKDEKTYIKLKKDPTKEYKQKFAKVLKQLLDTHAIDKKTHKFVYPTTESPPRFYGLPKVHKEGIPLRPIVSSINSISYNCARYVADLLAPLVGNSEHHIKKFQTFC